MPFPQASDLAQSRSDGFRRGLVTAAALAILGAAAGCRGERDDSGEVSAAAEGGVRERQATRVVTAPVERREMVRLLETTSVVESEGEIDVVPRAGGIVTQLNVEEGDTVVVGQVLAKLDDREEAMALRDAEIALEEANQAVDSAAVAVAEADSRIANASSTFEQAQRDLDRDAALRTGGDNPFGSVSEKTVEASRLARDQAEQELTQARLAHERSLVEQAGAKTAVTRAVVTRDRAALALERMSITAPIAGRIAERNIRIGATVDMAAPAFKITDVSRLRTVFFRPQRELALFRGAGGDDQATLELTATAEAAPDTVFRGRIERTSPTIDPTSGSFRVTARLARHPEEGPEAGSLLPGMLTRIQIVTDRRPDALAVPKRAVRREGEQAFVQVAEAGVARRVLVTEGYSDDDYVELRLTPGTDLDEDDRVIVVGGRDLEDGDAIVEGDDAEGAELDDATATVDGQLETDGSSEAVAAPTGDDQ